MKFANEMRQIRIALRAVAESAVASTMPEDFFMELARDHFRVASGKPPVCRVCKGTGHRNLWEPGAALDPKCKSCKGIT